MNVLMMAAAVAAINPSFVGAWCSTSGDPVAMFTTQNEYVDSQTGYVCQAAGAQKTTSLFEAETLPCSELNNLKWFSPLAVNARFTKTPSGLTQWYVDRKGQATVQRKLVKCVEPMD